MANTQVLIVLLFFTPPLVGERIIVMTVSVCMQAYLGNYISDLTKFLCMLPINVAWSSSAGVARCYVLLVLRMASYLHMQQQQLPVYGHYTYSAVD